MSISIIIKNTIVIMCMEYTHVNVCFQGTAAEMSNEEKGGIVEHERGKQVGK